MVPSSLRRLGCPQNVLGKEMNTPCVYVPRVDFRPFVYGLVDPLEPDHIRYVGLARIPSRPFDHARAARRQATRSSYKINWIRKLQADGREPTVLVLEELPESVSTFLIGFVESSYIKSLRQIGHHLTNLTDGGEGLINPAQEVRDRISASQTKAMSSPEIRKQISDKQKIRLASRPDLLQSASISARAQRHTLEAKQAIGEKSKELWSDPEWHDTHAAKIKTTWSNPDIRAKQSERIKASWSNPERRLKQKEALAKYWSEEERAKRKARE